MSYYSQIAELKRQDSELAQKLVEMARHKGADQVRVVISAGKGVEADSRHGDVESIEFYQDKSLTLTVIKDQRVGSVRSSDLSLDALNTAVDSALTLASFSSQDEFAGLADSNDLMQEYEKQDLELLHELIEDADYAVEQAVSLDKKALAQVEQEAELKDSDGASFCTFYTLRTLANSHGFVGSQVESEVNKSVTLCGERDGTMQRDSGYSVARKIDEVWSDERVLDEACTHTLGKLGGKQVPTGTYPIILSRHAAQSLMGNVLQAMRGSLIYRSSSFLKDKINEQIFPSFINICEDPLVKGGLYSSLFDGDGVKARKIEFVKDGVLKDYLLDAYSARKLKMANNGHKDSSYNWYVSADSEHSASIEEIQRQVGKGLVLTSLMGQGVNLVSGNYSRGASGYYFENGERVHAVEQVTIAGNLRDMMMSIAMLGDDIDSRYRVQIGSILLPSMTVSGK